MKNKNELSAALTRLRMSRLLVRQGKSEQEATQIADDTIRQGGVSGMAAMATPEGAIVTIVESYLQYVARRSVELGGADHFAQANKEAIDAIEQFRSVGVAGARSYPYDIDEYVCYRTCLEVPVLLGYEPEAIGLDRETVRILTHTAKANLLRVMTNSGSPGSGQGRAVSGGSSACFIATACFDAADHESVMLFRRYRDTVLRKSKLGRSAVYWYYRASPRVAGLIRRHVFLKRTCAWVLVALAKALGRKYSF